VKKIKSVNFMIIKKIMISDEFIEACESQLFDDEIEEEIQAFVFFLRDPLTPLKKVEVTSLRDLLEHLVNTIEDATSVTKNFLQKNKIEEVSKIKRLSLAKVKEILKQSVSDSEIFPVQVTPSSFTLISLILEAPLPVPLKRETRLKEEPAPTKPERKSQPKSKSVKIHLIRFPDRKAWPYGAVGDTKSVRDLFGYDKTEAVFVSNVGKKFGKGWNVKESVADALRVSEQEGGYELFEYDSAGEYENSQ
jgi:hypothetical protein